MVMSATYATFGGRIVKESRGGTVRRYVPDTLGSTSRMTDSSGVVTDSLTYWPYGEERSRTGSTPTPFRFVGTLGYYTDAAGRLYVRARTLMARLARWLTVDPLWPFEMAYGYVRNMPELRVDPTGLWSWSTRNCSDEQRQYIKSMFSQWLTPDRIAPMLTCFDEVDCRLNSVTTYGPYPHPCIDAWMKNNTGPPDFVIDCNPSVFCGGKNDCAGTDHRAKPPVIHLCNGYWTNPKCAGHCVLAHELIHACGSVHVPGGNANFDCVRTIPGCKSF